MYELKIVNYQLFKIIITLKNLYLNKDYVI